MSENNFNHESTRLHGANLADYAVGCIDKGIEEAEAITIEHSLGHAVLKGLMSVEDAYECLEAYERAFINK
jgi:hypothetical protein